MMASIKSSVKPIYGILQDVKLQNRQKAGYYTCFCHYRSQCSKAGDGVSKIPWLGSIPMAPAIWVSSESANAGVCKTLVFGHNWIDTSLAHQ